MRVGARFGWTVCLLALVAGPVSAAEEKSTLSPAQKKEIREMVREYIMENPEIISEAITALQAKEEKQREEKRVGALKKHKDEIFSAADGTVVGNPKGDVTFVEFFDYNCGYCKSMFPAMMETINQ